MVFHKCELDACETRFEYSRDDADALAGELESIIGRIGGSEFSPRAEYDHLTCSRCPALGNLCPVTPVRERAVL